MKLMLTLFKETREPLDKRRLPPPIAEEIAGTFLVGRFKVEHEKGGSDAHGGNGIVHEISGRDARTLLDGIRTAIETNEPEMKGKRIPHICISFASDGAPSVKTLAGSEERIDIKVEPQSLKGPELSDIFNFIERVLFRTDA